MKLNLNDTGWIVTENKGEDYNYQIRFRTFTEDTIITSEYPQRLNIFWTMKDVYDDGYPTPIEIEKLHEFENRLIEATEYDNFSIMSMVLTGNGQREFVFHINNQNEFIKRLTNMPQNKEKYPIEIESAKDTHWDYYYNDFNNEVFAV